MQHLAMKYIGKLKTHGMLLSSVYRYACTLNDLLFFRQ